MHDTSLGTQDCDRGTDQRKRKRAGVRTIHHHILCRVHLRQKGKDSPPMVVISSGCAS